MISTPQMFLVQVQITSLEVRLAADPGDYMLQFELQELRIKLDKLSRIEKLGLRVIKGGKNSANDLTLPEKSTLPECSDRIK